ncbi:transcriptional regulator, Fnr-type [Oceanicola granulosus HTCC2516]|uniref:Transcriptional regulator, Fnr-type n=2 Tax=Oceanicola granulosus TaxID=252302 RepID=Q2CC85_OCEGH|nr:transcriptional regulator, Fnr-type [Oceanicola granulosus HTCC2516]
MSMMKPPNFGREHKVGLLRQLTDADWTSLSALHSEIRQIPARTRVIDAGVALHESLLLFDGLMVRHMSDRRGRRQMVAVQVPGDFVDLHSLPLGHLDHSVTTLTEVRVAVFPHDRLRAGLPENAGLSLRLWRLTLIDAAIHRRWTFRLGRLRALAGMADFFCEMDYRMRNCGHGTDDGFHLPLTQSDLAEVCGLSPIHVNRVLRDLREAGLCTFADGRVLIHDREELCRLGEFDPSYLYFEDDLKPGFEEAPAQQLAER